jgi:hypothetical protein
MIRTLIRISLSILGILCLLGSPTVFARLNVTKPSLSSAPSQTVTLSFKDILPQKSGLTISNFTPEEKIEFSIRKDQLVSQAVLHLQFTPSPALIPVLSQLKIYLNDELIHVISINTEQLGTLSTADVPIDPLYIKDFNALRFEFIGHYSALCENPAHSSLWITINKFSALELTTQTLLLKDDLANFPEPFFDSMDNKLLSVPVVFAGQPDLMQQRAAAILASWFGSKALWRGVSFSALFNELPERNSIVFATNEQRPDFLKNYKKVTAPTVELMSHPNNPYIKILLILGRDDQDLITAVQGIAQGNILFRGQSVLIEQTKTLKPRKPYDAPNWIQTNKPVSFAQIQEMKQQLETKGVVPYPVVLRFNLPPDLYLSQQQGIEFSLNYRYSPPPQASLSHLEMSLNGTFIKNFTLNPDSGDKNRSSSQSAIENSEQFYLSPITPDIHNLLLFDFQYGTQIAGGLQNNQCTTYMLVNNYGVIDPSSSIDFSNYYHYITMPNLSAFIESGFPFSRLADLSETIVYINPQSKPEAVSTLLNALGTIGSQTGYPALAVSLTDDWSQVKDKNADLLIIGALPEDLLKNDTINLLLNKTEAWVKEPFNENAMPSTKNPSAVAESKTTINATGAIAAIVGIQSPNYSKRSIVILRADDQPGFELLNKTLTDTEHRDKIFGSIAIIRDSGVESVRVGPVYHLGNLPWWKGFWVALQKQPIALALTSLLAAIIITFLLWRSLLVIHLRRLQGEARNE